MNINNPAVKKPFVCTFLVLKPTTDSTNFFRQQNNDPNITVSQLEIEKYNSQLSNEKLLFEYFKSHFKIVQKNFRSKTHRLAAEAFYIKMNRPKLNEQKEQELFQLFGK